MSPIELQERRQVQTPLNYQPDVWSLEDVSLFVKTQTAELNPPPSDIELVALTGLVNATRPLTDNKEEWDTRFRIVNAAVHQEAGNGDARSLLLLNSLRSMRILSTVTG